MDAQGVSQILVAVGATSIVTGTISTFANKRKLGADAAKVITDAAAAVVSTTKARLDELEEEAMLRRKTDEALRAALMRHEVWDRKITRIIRDLAPELDIDEPPTLYPALYPTGENT